MKTINQTVLEIELSGIRLFAEEANQVKDVIRLTLGEPAFDTPSNIKQAAIDALHANDTHYPHAQGLRGLREAICAFEYKTQGIEYSADEVIITQGASGGLFACIQAICNPLDEIIVFLPAYTIYEPLIRLAGGVPVLIDCSDHQFQIDENQLRKAITSKTKAILINSPNNPTGATLNKTSLDIVEKIVLEFDLLVISDDVYNQLIFEPTEFLVSRASLRKHLIYVQSFSKPYAMTGWRIGYIMADQKLVESINKVNAYMVAGIAPFIQQAAIVACDSDVRHFVLSYQKTMIKVCQILDKKNIEYVKPQGAFYCWVSIESTGLDSWTFARKLLHEHKIAVIPGAVFGGKGDQYIRTSLATKPAIAIPAFKTLANFIVKCSQ